MNEELFYRALNYVDIAFVEECLEESRREIKRRVLSATWQKVLAAAACLAILVGICGAAGVFRPRGDLPITPSPHSNIPGEVTIDPDPHTGEPDPMSKIPPSIYGDDDRSALMKVDSINFHGVYYSFYPGTRDTGFPPNRIAVFEVTVDEDYYHHLEHGEKILIAFHVEHHRTDDSFYQIDPDPFIQGLQACDSLILYVQAIQDPSYSWAHYGYPNEKCKQEEEIRFGKMGICYYEINGFIPIIDSHVDFSFMEDALQKSGYEGDLLSWKFEDINWSGLSIAQGDSLEDAVNTILQLIDMKVYGG